MCHYLFRVEKEKVLGKAVKSHCYTCLWAQISGQEICVYGAFCESMDEPDTPLSFERPPPPARIAWSCPSLEK